MSAKAVPATACPDNEAVTEFEPTFKVNSSSLPVVNILPVVVAAVETVALVYLSSAVAVEPAG
jgi:hypothetical protein